MRYTPNLCRSCARLNQDDGGATCEAFPRGIPDEIRVHGGDHREPVPGDSGKVYVPDARRAGDLADWRANQ